MLIKHERHREYYTVRFVFHTQPQSVMTHVVVNGTKNCLIYTLIKNRALRNIWANDESPIKVKSSKETSSFFAVHSVLIQGGNKNIAK